MKIGKTWQGRVDFVTADKQLRAVKCYLTGRENASFDKPSVAGIMAAHWQ
jgi:hypothetical protein